MKRLVENRNSWNAFILGVKAVTLLLLVAPANTLAQKDFAKLEFRGNRVLAQSELAAVTQKCLAADAHWIEKPDSETLDYCLAQLRFFLYSKGYLQAAVEKPLKKETPEGLRVIITIAEGALFRVGRVEVKGSNVLAPAQLLEMLDFKTGDVADASVLERWLHKKIRLKYATLGFFNTPMRYSLGSVSNLANQKVLLTSTSQLTKPICLRSLQ